MGLVVRALPGRVPRLPAALGRARAPRRVHRHRLQRHARARSRAFLRSLPGQLPQLLRPERPASALALSRTPRSTPVTYFYTRSGVQYIHQGAYPSAPSSNRTSALRAGRVTRCPRSASTRSSGHRTIVAGERSRRPAASRAARRPSRSTRARPVRRGQRGTAPRPSSTRCARRAAPPDSPGWTVRVVPNLLSGARPPRWRPAPRAGRQRAPDLSRRCPPPGAHEVIVNAPRPGALARGAARRRSRGAAVEVWRERMRAHAEARLPAADRQRAPRGGSLAARTPTRSCTRSTSCRRLSRASASASAPTRRARWASSLLGRPRRRGGPPRASGSSRSTTRRCCSRPTPRALPYQLMLVPRRPRARFEEDGPDRRRAAARRRCAASRATSARARR